jgi:hypothetical protein
MSYTKVWNHVHSNNSADRKGHVNLMVRLFGVILVALAFAFPSAAVKQPVAGVPKVTVVTVEVQRVPTTPILDFTHPWPVIPGASIRIAELGQTVKADAKGQATLRLPLGPTGEAVYTFVVTVPESKYRSVTRRRIYQGGDNFSLLFDPSGDFMLDYTKAAR